MRRAEVKKFEVKKKRPIRENRTPRWHQTQESETITTIYFSALMMPTHSLFNIQLLIVIAYFFVRRLRFLAPQSLYLRHKCSKLVRLCASIQQNLQQTGIEMARSAKAPFK